MLMHKLCSNNTFRKISHIKTTFICGRCAFKVADEQKIHFKVENIIMFSMLYNAE